MYTYEWNNFYLDISSNCIDSYKEGANIAKYSNHEAYIVRRFMPSLFNTISNFIDNRIIHTGHFRMLDAHGGNKGEKYVYGDEGKIYPVEEWIKKYADENDILYINVCNKSIDGEYRTILTPANCGLIYPKDSTDICDIIDETERGANRQNIIFVPPINHLPIRMIKYLEKNAPEINLSRLKQVI